MRIAIDCRYLGMSGIGTFLQNILQTLLASHPEHEYLLVCNENCEAMIRDHKHAKVLQMKAVPLSFRELFCFPVREINRCDVFFTPYVSVPVGITVPVFTTIHDMLFFDCPELFSALQRWSRKLYLKRTIRKSSGIFTVSQFSKSRIEHHFGQTRPVRVLGNSICGKLKGFVPAGIQKDDTIVFVGNIKEHKGLRSLLQAFAGLRQDGCKSELLIIGESQHFRTKDKATLALLENQAGLSFTGYLSDEELYDRVARARLLVQPSFYEGFGIPPMEALYLGTNVLVSDIPVFREVYQNLPVTFFKVGDVSDLKNKMRADYPALDVARVRADINQQYAIQGQVNLLLEDLMKVVAR